MKTVQKRSVPFGRLSVIGLAGAALVTALGLLATNDTFELPVIGGDELTMSSTRDDAPVWNPPADSMPGASILSSVGDTGSDQVTAKAGHRHELYLDEGYQFDGNLARPQGTRSIPLESLNHRIVFNEFEPTRENGGGYRENSRIGLTAD